MPNDTQGEAPNKNKSCSCSIIKILGRLWLAYTELQGGFYMFELISVDSRHFTPRQGGPRMWAVISHA